MKNIFLTASLFIAATSISFAQQDTTEAPAQDTTSFIMNQEMEMALAFAQDEKAIKTEELPAGVRAALKTEKYKGWKVESANAVQGKDGVHYKVVITSGDKKETLKFDEEGNAIA